MRALGLDVGTKTIGVALIDEAGIAAHPHSVISRGGNVADIAALRALCGEHGVTDIVIGMPFELSGRVGHRARRVQLFVQALHTALGDSVKLHEQDERFTTAQAERVMIEADVSRARRREVIDQQAAALILQAWLDLSRAKTK